MLLSEVSGIKPSSRTFKPSNEFVSPSCPVGIEIEVEGLGYRHRVPTNPEFWDKTDDGSLRNGGMELVSKPVFGEDIILALDDLTVALEGKPYILSDRCGLHIHIDASGMTTEQLLANCCAYALVESALYNYVGNKRRENIFCLPISRTGNILPYLNSIKYGRTSEEIADAILGTCKYSGFNILPVMRQGSIEYRHHAGTVDKDKIIKWINIIMQIREAAFNYSAVELTSMEYEFVKEILLPPDIEYSYQDWLDGYITAKDILNFNKLETEWMEVKDIFSDDSRIRFNRVTVD